jgi:4-amino-4-deoxy-L-arabinose transferase-like glycosyltransferase
LRHSPLLRFVPAATWVWHLALLIAVSAGYESLFIERGLNVRDEGWPLYAAMQMHAGGTLYDDVLWVFPPGHVLPAWVGAWIDAPGIEITRMIYAGFSVALVAAMYVLSRRLMPASFALLGGLLLAVAAPRTHMMHAIYGYRYLVFCVLALLAFDRRLATGNPRWMLAAGFATGLGFFFRYDPASALVVALAIAVVASDRAPRVWLRDALWYAAGGLIVGLPVLIWFGSTVGLRQFFFEAAIHPLAMLQALPVPELMLPDRVSRAQLVSFFITLQFRIYVLLFLVYVLVLGFRLVRAWRERRSFESPLLLAIVIWGGIYFVRSFGRADEPHLDSAIPPVCLLLAHAAHAAYVRWPRLVAQTAVVVGGFVLWIFLLGVDAMFDNPFLNLEVKGELPVTWSQKKRIDKIREWSSPRDQILDLTASPMLLVATGRSGYGYRDVVMPGTFVEPEEEERFLRLLEASPPALVIWPLKVFDEMSERSLRKTAPQVVKWVLARYEMHAFDDEMAFLRPIGSGEPPVVEDLTGKGRTLTTAPRKRAGAPRERRR